MLRKLARSALTNAVEKAVRKGVQKYTLLFPDANIPYSEQLVQSIIGELGDSIQDMLDIIGETFRQ